MTRTRASAQPQGCWRPAGVDRAGYHKIWQTSPWAAKCAKRHMTAPRSNNAPGTSGRTGAPAIGERQVVLIQQAPGFCFPPRPEHVIGWVSGISALVPLRGLTPVAGAGFNSDGCLESWCVYGGEDNRRYGDALAGGGAPGVCGGPWPPWVDDFPIRRDTLARISAILDDSLTPVGAAQRRRSRASSPFLEPQRDAC